MVATKNALGGNVNAVGSGNSSGGGKFGFKWMERGPRLSPDEEGRLVAALTVPGEFCAMEHLDGHRIAAIAAATPGGFPRASVESLREQLLDVRTAARKTAFLAKTRDGAALKRDALRRRCGGATAAEIGAALDVPSSVIASYFKGLGRHPCRDGADCAHIGTCPYAHAAAAATTAAASPPATSGAQLASAPPIPGGGGPAAFGCTVCGVTVNSKAQLDEHRAGTKHLKRIAALELTAVAARAPARAEQTVEPTNSGRTVWTAVANAFAWMVRWLSLIWFTLVAATTAAQAPAQDRGAARHGGHKGHGKGHGKVDKGTGKTKAKAKAKGTGKTKAKAKAEAKAEAKVKAAELRPGTPTQRIDRVARDTVNASQAIAALRTRLAALAARTTAVEAGKPPGPTPAPHPPSVAPAAVDSAPVAAESPPPPPTASPERVVDKVAQRGAGSAFERRVEGWFAKRGVSFKTDAELKEEQECAHGRAIATPDLLFSTPIKINGTDVRWLECKNFYATADAGVVGSPRFRKLEKQLKRYKDTWGPGCVVFAKGFATALPAVLDGASVGVLVLDASTTGWGTRQARPQQRTGPSPAPTPAVEAGEPPEPHPIPGGGGPAADKRFGCAVCGVTVNSKVQLDAHRAGTKHLKGIAALELTAVAAESG